MGFPILVRCHLYIESDPGLKVFAFKKDGYHCCFVSVSGLVYGANDPDDLEWITRSAGVFKHITREYFGLI